MNIVPFTAETASAGFDPTFWILIIAMLALMYFLTIRPQKKEEKKKQEMLNQVDVGDEIVTIGGIKGRVVSVSAVDNTVLLETGSDRTRIRILKEAIRSNETRQEAALAEKKATLEAKQAEKASKKK